jgi:hypothetical protein
MNLIHLKKYSTVSRNTKWTNTNKSGINKLSNNYETQIVLNNQLKYGSIKLINWWKTRDQ